MFLNATLVVQAVHFIFAYVLLRFFLYKPVVNMIQARDKAHGSLVDNVNTKKALITSLRQRLEEHMHVEQTKLLHRKPEVKEAVFHIQVPSLTSVPTLSPQDKKELIEELVQSLVVRIDHVP